jgi:bifunctional DNase/RNase
MHAKKHMNEAGSMALIQMDIQTIVVGGGPVASLLVLKPRIPEEAPHDAQLPIKIGPVEAMAIGMGVNDSHRTTDRPMTHDLLNNVIESLGAHLDSVIISAVSGTTFFAQLRIEKDDGEAIFIDSRPSDAIALAVRTGAPIYARSDVLTTASYPDFKGVEKEEEEHEMEEFHKFVENLSPDDFANDSNSSTK